MSEKEKKSVSFLVRMTPSDKEKLIYLAESDRRSAADYICKLINEEYKRSQK